MCLEVAGLVPHPSGRAPGRQRIHRGRWRARETSGSFSKHGVASLYGVFCSPNGLAAQAERICLARPRSSSESLARQVVFLPSPAPCHWRLLRKLGFLEARLGLRAGRRRRPGDRLIVEARPSRARASPVGVDERVIATPIERAAQTQKPRRTLPPFRLRASFCAVRSTILLRRL